MLQEFYTPHALLHSVRGLVMEIKVFSAMKSWDIKFLVKPLLHKQQKMTRKWQLQRLIFLKAIAGIQYNFKFGCRLGHIFICWCSFACNILSQNHLNSVPEHRGYLINLSKTQNCIHKKSKFLPAGQFIDFLWLCPSPPPFEVSSFSFHPLRCLCFCSALFDILITGWLRPLKHACRLPFHPSTLETKVQWQKWTNKK